MATHAGGTALSAFQSFEVSAAARGAWRGVAWRGVAGVTAGRCDGELLPCEGLGVHCVKGFVHQAAHKE